MFSKPISEAGTGLSVYSDQIAGGSVSLCRRKNAGEITPAWLQADLQPQMNRHSTEDSAAM